MLLPVHAQTKMVFAHYMITNQDYQADTDPTGQLKIQAYEKEIQQAQAAGIDGFALNCGGWFHESTNNYYYVRYSQQMFQAAVNLNSGFKLMFSADMTASNTITDVEDMMRRFANDSTYSQVYFKYNNKPVLTTFSGDSNGTAFWQQVKSDLATGANAYTPPSGFSTASTAPMNIVLVPAFFWGGELPAQSQIQTGFNQWSSIIDGSFYWGIAGVPGSGGSVDQLPSSEAYASVVHSGGKLYMAPVCLQFWGANASRYYEYSGFSGLRKMWMDAINVSHPDWIEDITWNDFIEGSYISPIDDPDKYQYANFLSTSGIQTWGSTNGPPMAYWHSHYAAADLSKYFIQWYKTGTQPAINSDTIYWAYRTQPQAVNAGSPGLGNWYGPIQDDIFVTCNLAAPATLTVNSAGTVTTINVPAGSTDVMAPFAVGNPPTFTLTRNGSTVLSGTGTDSIQNPPIFTDYTSGTSTLNDEYYSTGDVSAAFNQAPSTPTNLTATAGNSQVALSWNASTGSSPLTYNVYRGTAAGGESTTAIASNLSGTTYTDTTAANGTKYYYVVKAVNSLGTSGSSNEASATPQAPTLASVPTGLTATAGDATVNLSWSASTGSAPITYNVYRSTTSGGEGTTAIKTGLTGTSFTDNGLASGTTYYYKVSATNAAGTSAQSAEASAKTLTMVYQIDCGSPSAVAPFAADEFFDVGTDFSAGSVSIDTSQVTNPAPQGVYQTVRWNSSFNYTIPGLTAGSSYLVRLHFCELSFTAAGSRKFNVAINGNTVLSAFDVFAAAGGQNKAIVKEFNATANSGGQIVIAFSQGGADNPDVAGIEIFGGSGASQTPPSTPSGLSASAGNAQVSLSWTGSSGATSYNVYRGTTAGGEGATPIATGLTGTSYTNTGLTNGTTYYYKVAAVNSAGTSGMSNEASATPTGSTGEAPYGGTPAAIPGTVQAENFDTGGEGVGYHDADAANQGGQYRTTEGVDIETCSDTGGGYDVGWTNAGEWMKYTVNVASAGTYTVTFRVANGTTANGSFHLQNASGANLSGAVTVAPTGGWQTWANVTANVTLPAGQQILTFYEDTANFNINYMSFAAASGGQPDLIVTSISWTPNPIAAGNQVVFSCVVKNQGTAATPAGTTIGVQFAVDGATSPINWSDTDTTSLAPGASVTLTANNGTNGVNYWPATSGSHTVQAWVDDVNRIAESNENNNKLTASFSVP
jgi:fibronectin type 3 domain-containing protein